MKADERARTGDLEKAAHDLAASGDIKGAAAKYAQALTLDPTLTYDPKQKAEWVYAVTLGFEGDEPGPCWRHSRHDRGVSPGCGHRSHTGHQRAEGQADLRVEPERGWPGAGRGRQPGRRDRILPAGPEPEPHAGYRTRIEGEAGLCAVPGVDC